MKKPTIFTVFTAIFLCCALSLTGCGMNKKFNENTAITLTTRQDGSSIRSAFMDLIDLSGNAEPNNAAVKNDAEAVINEVKENIYAIGYDTAGNMNSGVKALKIDGVAPTEANVRNGSYKLSRDFTLIYKQASLEKPENAEFLNFIKSMRAEEIIKNDGFIIINENMPEYNKTDVALAGTINISGSAAIAPLMRLLADEFTREHPGVTVNINETSNAAGYTEAEDGTADFGIAAGRFEAEHAPNCMQHTIAAEAIAVIVNRENLLDNITISELKNIYNTNAGQHAVTKWSQLTNKQ